MPPEETYQVYPLPKKFNSILNFIFPTFNLVGLPVRKSSLISRHIADAPGGNLPGLPTTKKI
jgi:hypothetical protein